MPRLSGEPFVARSRLAFGAMSRAAGVKRDRLVPARLAAFEVGAEGCGPACADVAEYAPLLPGHGVSPGGEEFLLVLTKDIGDFEPMLRHCVWGRSSLASGRRSSASKGLRTA